MESNNKKTPKDRKKNYEKKVSIGVAFHQVMKIFSDNANKKVEEKLQASAKK